MDKNFRQQEEEGGGTGHGECCNARRLLFLKPLFTCLGSFKKTLQPDAFSASKSWKFGDSTRDHTS